MEGGHDNKKQKIRCFCKFAGRGGASADLSTFDGGHSACERIDVCNELVTIGPK